MSNPDLGWAELVDIVHRRRRLIATVAIGGVLLVSLGVFALGPSYQATATLIVTAERTRSISPDAEALPLVDRVTEEDLNSQAALLRNEDLVRQVLTPYRDTPRQPVPGLLSRIIGSPFHLSGWLYRTLHGIPVATDFEQWVYDTARQLDIGPVKDTNLIHVSYKERGIEPEWAATFVNALVDRGLAQQQRLGQQAEAQRFFDAQQQLLADRVAAAEQARSQFYEREGLDSMPEQRTLWRARMTELDTALHGAEADLASEAARVASLRAEIRRHPKVIAKESRLAQNQAVQFIKPRILEKEMERNELLSTYREDSLRVRDVERELAEAKALLEQEQTTVAEKTRAVNPTYQTLELDLAQAAAQAASTKGRVEALRAQIGDARAKLEHLDGVAAEQSRIEEEVGVAKEAFATYAKKQEQARLSSALDESRLVNVAIAQPAQAPVSPARGYRLTLIALGALMSLGAGLALAFVRDWLDPTVRGGSDAERVTGLPLLADLSS